MTREFSAFTVILRQFRQLGWLFRSMFLILSQKLWAVKPQHQPSPLWMQCLQGSHRCQCVTTGVGWIHRVSSRLCWQQMCEIFLIHCECSGRLWLNPSSTLRRVCDTITRSKSGNSTSQRQQQLLTKVVVWTLPSESGARFAKNKGTVWNNLVVDNLQVRYRSITIFRGI